MLRGLCFTEAGRVFRYDVATARVESDPTAFLRGALITPKDDPSRGDP